jgi:hypothetical protein
MTQLEDIPPEVVADAIARAVVDAVGEGGDRESIVRKALARAKGELGLTTAAQPSAERSTAAHIATAGYTAPPSHPNGHGIPAALGSGRRGATTSVGGASVITEGDVLDAVRSGSSELRVAPGVIVTALARDAARDAGLRLLEG